eukprot:jgi/Undpi1/13045/HiC_scaffold_8.g02708.m1
MDRVGIGESQTHATLWWDARARNVTKLVRDHGGMLSMHDVDETMLDRIKEGKVNNLAYDSGSAMIYDTSRTYAVPPSSTYGGNTSTPQPRYCAHAGRGGAGRVDGRFPYPVGNTPMAETFGALPPGHYYRRGGGVGVGSVGGGGGGADSESRWTVYRPEGDRPQGNFGTAGMHTRARVPPRTNAYVPSYGTDFPQGMPQQGVPYGVPHGAPQPQVIPESGPQPMPPPAPEIVQQPVQQVVPNNFPQAVPPSVPQAVPYGMPHGLSTRESGKPPGVDHRGKGRARMGNERPPPPPPPPTHRAHHQQDERASNAAPTMPGRDAAPEAAKKPVELNCDASEWSPSKPAKRAPAKKNEDEAIRHFQELMRAPHPPHKAVKIQKKFEKDGNQGQYLIDIRNWFATNKRWGSTSPPPTKVDAVPSMTGAPDQWEQHASPDELERTTPPAVLREGAERGKGVDPTESDENKDSEDARSPSAEPATRASPSLRSEKDTVRDFEVWAKTSGAPRQVVAVQTQFEKGGSKGRYIRQAKHLLDEREREAKKHLGKESIESSLLLPGLGLTWQPAQGGEDPATVRPGDAIQDSSSVLPADAREVKPPNVGNQTADEPGRPPSKAVETLKALVGLGPSMENMRKAVHGITGRGRRREAYGIQPPSLPPAAETSAVREVAAVGAVTVVPEASAIPAAGPVPEPDPNGSAGELAAGEASADSDAEKEASSLPLESVFRKGIKARHRRGESGDGRVKLKGPLLVGSDSTPKNSGDDSCILGVPVDDGGAGMARVGTDRKLDTDGEAGRRVGVEDMNGGGKDGDGGESCAHAKTPNEYPPATGKPAVAPTVASPPVPAPSPARTQATAPLRQEDSTPPSDGDGDSAAPAASIAGSEMIRIFLVCDVPTMADAAEALGAKRGEKGTGLLRNVLRGTGPVAVRLDGQHLGAEDGVIQTIQPPITLGDTAPDSLDKALMETEAGTEILSTELRFILEDNKIRKVMHDVHDHVVALARLFHGLPRFRVNTVLDLELAGECLGGDAHNSLGSALWSFDVCDDPRRNFKLDVEAFAQRPLGVVQLLPAAYGVVYLRESCRLAEKKLLSEGELANVFRASQLKADYAADVKRDGWRRMTFGDRGPGLDGNPGKKLSSYELNKASARGSGVELYREAGTPRDATPTKENRASGGSSKEATFSPTPKPRYIPPPFSKQNQAEKEHGVDTASSSASPGQKHQSGVKLPSPRTGKGFPPTGTNASDPVAPAWAGGFKGGEGIEAKITFGNLGTSPPVSSNADPSSCAKPMTKGGGEGGESGVDSSRSDYRGGGDAGGGGEVGGGTRGSQARVPGSQDARASESPSQRAPGAGRDGEEGNTENGAAASDSEASSDDDEDEDVDVLKMLKHLPNIFIQDALSERELVSDLEEIVLDQGTRPRALVRGIGKVYLCDDEEVLVTAYHINYVVGKFEHDGRLAADNRTGFDGLLHSVGVLRDKSGSIYGVTIRVRTFVKGVADVIDDLLFNPKQGCRMPTALSILVLGRRGSGKTTLMRDACRKLSLLENVLIVDTHNDIGGEGSIPHRGAIGDSRRIMVPPNTMQHSILPELFRNHNPQTLVIDEISSQEDVGACHDMKNLGVRVIAGAIGTLPSVLDSNILGGALGGLEPVETSDGEEDDSSASTSATKKEKRWLLPVFDAVVEVEGGRQPVWTVVQEVANVVDELLAKGSVAKPDIRAPLPPDAIIQQEAGTEGCDTEGGCSGFMQKVKLGEEDKWLW